MRCPAIDFEKSHLTVKNSYLFGYSRSSINESLSFINITGKGSHALLDNCTFKENCFIRSNLSDGIIVSNSIFQSYRHRLKSIIVALSSAVTLTGNVNFTDSITGIPSLINSFGTAVFLQTTHPEVKSSLNITMGATVYFVNLTCSYDGGAVSGRNTAMHIGAKARVVFMNNAAGWAGGAVYMWGGMITIDAESYVIFTCNHADKYGGALSLRNSTAHVNTSGIEFYDNRASVGGAIHFTYGSMVINTNKSLKFIMNSAQVNGGAIYIKTGVYPSIIVGNFSELMFFNNSAFQGGALYSIMPSLLVTTVGYQSSIQFINNTAFDVGGAVYSQSSQPCIFMITDYSAKISFTGNYAQHGVGHHMYGASVRDDSCSIDRFHKFSE